MIKMLQEVRRMGLQELLDKYDKDMRTGDNWFTLKKRRKYGL